ncbi:LacI family DNA-binding transcriptional regulator [Cellulomonas denverensis]|uniref:LacI family transcriptional regulator n=1 Tax=Cellulomonas denverensis TaxID=264297 RepID=A0A7X6QY06_9CELL|nr:LacI family DNA-binding transcriptional regulator [Cellulomonas denverensis]NKY21476.1 LacI family transcriptional regulator [Cellulomonas denverensis]GIG26988.1 LacI family transcriptional regulator [Cellulomonas denverensis]
MTGRGAVTLQEVARVAGVSPRTVSNVVNGYEHVAPRTREQVQAVIDALGYRANAAARSLRTGRTGLLGLVVPALDQPYFAELARAVVREATGAGFTVVVDQTDGDPARERELLLRGPRGAMFDGLVLSPLALSAGDLLAADPARPVVLLGERTVDTAFDHVHIDNVAAARAATDHLIGTGRRRIAAIGLQTEANTGRQRAEGFMLALAEAGLPAHPRLLRYVESFDRASGFAAMSAMLDDELRPDAVFCFNDMLAIGALRACLTRGLQVPGDVAVMGFDDVEEVQYATPSLSTVRPDRDAIARVAVARLLARVERRSAAGPAEDITVPHRIVLRESTGPA